MSFLLCTDQQSYVVQHLNDHLRKVLAIPVALSCELQIWNWSTIIKAVGSDQLLNIHFCEMIFYFAFRQLELSYKNQQEQLRKDSLRRKLFFNGHLKTF